MVARRYRVKALLFDILFHPLPARIASLTCFTVYLALRLVHPRWSFLALCKAHRFVARTGSTPPAFLERRIRIASASIQEPTGRAFERRIPLKAALVLKTPRYIDGRIVEKGVILVKYTDYFDAFRRSLNLNRLLDHYTLVLEPAWSTYANRPLLAYCAFPSHVIIVMASAAIDYQFLKRLRSNLRPITLGSGDWVNPNIFLPIAGQPKSFDAVMVARWALFKGHHLLFRAMRRLGDPSFRVALVASTITRDPDRDAILALMQANNISSQVTVFENLDPAGVNKVLNQSKVNLLLSRQEGSNRTLFEGFFAGVPGLAFDNHVGIRKSHFNSDTGRLIADRDLSDALLYFREYWGEFNPRPWALANISPEVSTSKLNHCLREIASQRGEAWTTDIAAKCNCPSLAYYPNGEEASRFPTVVDLLEEFPSLR